MRTPSLWQLAKNVNRDNYSEALRSKASSSNSFITMNVESWCTVELNSKQDWLRANRKHNQNAFASSVFKGDSNQHHASRLDFNSSVPDKHKERRHFPDKGK